VAVAVEAEALLTPLARELDRAHPSAAASPREGMAETWPSCAWGCPDLARTLHSKNPIESMIEICQVHSKNVKRWRDEQTALRWCAVGMLEADHQFRRVNAHLHLPKLRTALKEHFRGNVSPAATMRPSTRPDDHGGRHRSSTDLGTTSDPRMPKPS
jgi:putative transposase